MSQVKSNRIAKNTVYMYIRMILVMLVTIYTSRVVLDKLGIIDYGIFNAVASVVAIISFLSATLNTSTSRFLAFELGHGDRETLRNTFSTALFSHLLLALFVVLLMETLGLWYLSNKFVITEGREIATNVVFHISILTTVISICSVPFSSTIIAHEKLSIYAWIGIFEAVAKLAVVYLLSIASMDKLILYSILLALIQIIVTGIFFVFCLSKFNETRMFPKYNKKIFLDMLGFTGWTSIANVSSALIIQGSTILMNLFFSPAIIATKSLASQVTNAIMQFVNNFRFALNPQIIKSYASGDIEASHRLTMQSTIITFDLLLILGLPCIMTMDAILDLWLVEVPPLAVEFTRIAIFSQILGSISSSTYIGFVSSGKLKSNALWGLFTGVMYFVLLYVIYKLGGCVLWVQYLQIIHVLVWILVLRPLCMSRELGYKTCDIFNCYWVCLKVLIMATFLSFGCALLLNNSLWQKGILFILTVLFSAASSLLFMEKNMRDILKRMVIAKFINK